MLFCWKTIIREYIIFNGSLCCHVCFISRRCERRTERVFHLALTLLITADNLQSAEAVDIQLPMAKSNFGTGCLFSLFHLRFLFLLNKLQSDAALATTVRSFGMKYFLRNADTISFVPMWASTLL